MTVCVDFLQTIQPKSKSVAKYGNQWCHMFSDCENEEELHQMARKIGLKKSYFQDHKFLPHYDLTPQKRSQIIALGAIERESASIVRARMKSFKKSE